MYDVIAGAKGLEWSHYLTPGQARARFPTLCSHRKGDGASLKGAIVYHDGQVGCGWQADEQKAAVKTVVW